MEADVDYDGELSIKSVQYWSSEKAYFNGKMIKTQFMLGDENGTKKVIFKKTAFSVVYYCFLLEMFRSDFEVSEKIFSQTPFKVIPRKFV